MAIPLANPLHAKTRACQLEVPKSWRAPAVLSLWHLASLDAPTVAVVWALAFAWAARVHVEAWTVVVLFCGTWTVYIGDRLLDARRAIRVNDVGRLRERHHFHWRHRRTLIALALCSAVTAGSLILRLMPVIARERNSLLGAAALAYFSGVHSSAKLPEWLRRIGSKELLVGIIFAGGCAAPSFWRAHVSRWPLIVCVLFFSALAWLNCSAIEEWESRARASRIARGSLVLCAAGLIAGGSSGLLDPRIAALFLAGSISAALLGMLNSKRHSVTSLTLRVLADAVLLTPAILIALGVIRA